MADLTTSQVPQARWVFWLSNINLDSLSMRIEILSSSFRIGFIGQKKFLLDGDDFLRAQWERGKQFHSVANF